MFGIKRFMIRNLQGANHLVNKKENSVILNYSQLQALKHMMLVKYIAV